MRLLTPRLVLRPVTPDDRHDLHRLEQDPEVMQYLNGGIATPLVPIDPDAVPYRMPRGLDPDVWAVVERDSGSLAGWVALHIEGAAGELGYRFFRAAWGRGYATEAARALMADAFARLGLAQITARTMARNTRSRRVMERLGMRHIETRHDAGPDWLPGAVYGEVEYSIERHEWHA